VQCHGFRAYLKPVLCRIRVQRAQIFFTTIPEHTTVPISRKELWRQQEEHLLQRDLGFVIRERLVSCRVILRCREEEEGSSFLCKEQLFSTLNLICVRVFLYDWLSTLVGNF